MGGKADPGDMQQAAIQQGEFDKEAVNQQTWANRPTQYTPWGYTSWNANPVTDPATGQTVTQWEQTQGLTPELQDLLNKQVAIQGGRTDIAGMLTGRLGNEYGQAMNWDNFSPLAGTPQSQFTIPEGEIGDPYGTRQRAEDAMYAQAESRLQPRFQAQRAQLETQMRNQGLGPEDAAWQARMQGLDQQETDAYNQATWSAVGEGRDESGQMWNQLAQNNQNQFQQALAANQQNYGQAMQGANYANQLRQQQITEMMQQRGYGLNEINALLSGQQVGMPQMPSFGQAQSAGGAPIYQGAADAASLQNAQSPWGGLLNAGVALGSAALGASDRRLKRNIRRIGTVRGKPWYRFDYVWGEPGEGVMADEAPEFAVRTPGGYLAVDYGRLLS